MKSKGVPRGRQSPIKRVDHPIRAVLNALGRLDASKSRTLGKWFGRLWFATAPRRYALAVRNIRCSFPEMGNSGFARHMARQAFENIGQTIFEVFRLGALEPERLLEWVKFEGIEHYEKALARGKGVLLLTAHLGNWELLALTFPLVKEPGIAIARPLDFKPVDRYMEALRSSTGNQVLSKDGSIRSVLNALKEGKNVGVLLDQNTSHREGVFVPFFGRRACTNRSIAFLALATDCAVVPAYDNRLPSGRHVISIWPELELRRSGDKTRDIEDNTALFTRIIEQMIRKNPGQWLWMHNRWAQKPWSPWPRRSI